MVDREEDGATKLLLWANGRRKVVGRGRCTFAAHRLAEECPPSVGGLGGG